MRYILYDNDNDNIILICDSVSRQFIIKFHPRMVIVNARYYVNHMHSRYNIVRDRNIRLTSLDNIRICTSHRIAVAVIVVPILSYIFPQMILRSK